MNPELIIGVIVLLVGLVTLYVIRKKLMKDLGSDLYERLSIFPSKTTKHSEIDPLAEAEVYIAYGQKKKAIGLLERAQLEQPNRADITKKLDALASRP